MKIAILAAGGKNWDRTNIEIKGEKIIDRLVRQLNERGFEDIYLSLSPGQHVILPTERRIAGFVVNELNGNDLGCITGIPAFDLYIFGDVYFSDAGIDAVLSGETEFYGRTKAGAVKNYGEMFALKGTDRLLSTLDRMWQEYKTGVRRRLWSWDLYSEIQGKDFYKYRNTGNFTEINDETEDFDKPADVDNWKNKHDQRA